MPLLERRTRKIRRWVEVKEYRCQYCGWWFEPRRSDQRYCPKTDRKRCAWNAWAEANGRKKGV